MFKHELAKFLKAFELICDGYEIYVEVIFKNGGRADILIPERYQVIEIVDSETEERLNKKRITYPQELDIVAFRAENIIAEKGLK